MIVATSVLMSLVALSSGASDSPLIMLRQTSATDGGTMRKILEIHGRHPGSGDEVWLGTAGWWPTADVLLKEVRSLAGLRPQTERLDIRLGFQQGVTLGHGTGFSAAGQAAKTYSFTDAAWAVDKRGRRLRTLCARSPEAQAFEEEHVATICRELRPSSLWLDDDLRIGVWKPDACFCDRCLEAFAAETGEKMSRDELVRRLFSGQEVDSIRSKWFDFNARSMALFAAAARRGADSVKSDCRLCLQMGNSCFYYTGIDFSPTLRALSDNGRKPVGIRSGMGFYTDANPRGMLDSLFDVMRESARCRRLGPWIANIANENENYTRQVFNKSWEATLKESALAFAAGCDSTSVYWYDGRRPEPLSYEEEFAEGLAAWRPYYERLSDVSRHTRPGGVARRIPANYADRLPEALRGKECDFDARTLAIQMTRHAWRPAELMPYGIPVIPAEADPVAEYDGEDLVEFVQKGMNGPTTDELERLRDLFDRRSGGKVPVRLGKTHPMAVFPRIDAENRLVAVTVWNLSLGRVRNMPVRLRNVREGALTWARGGAEDRLLTAADGDLPGERVVVLPDLEGFGIGTIFCSSSLTSKKGK